MTEHRLTVSMVGLGSMGSALANAIVRAGHDLTVWNRSDAKCQPLAEQGAAVASSVREAVSSSEVIVACVRGYDAANSLLRDEDVATALDDKIVIQLGNGVPTEVADAGAWFATRGVAYLDGSIMAFPDAVGSSDCQVLVSGEPVAFDRCRPLFDAIGGDIRFLGADPTASAVVNSSALAFVYVSAHAFLSAAAMCHASDAPIDLLAEVVGTFTSQMPALFGGYVDMIETGQYDSTTLRLASGAENLRAVADFGRQSGVDTGLFDEALETLDVAIAADRGVNLAAIFEELRRKST